MTKCCKQELSLGTAKYDFPIQPIALVGRAAVTIWNMTRNLSMHA